MTPSRWRGKPRTARGAFPEAGGLRLRSPRHEGDRPVLNGGPVRAGAPGLPVLIAGGGIGGLALALMLHAQGLACAVLEAATDIRPLGVGINILPHSIRELARLGLLPRLDAVAVRTRRLTYMNHLGQQIWTEPRGLHAGHDCAAILGASRTPAPHAVGRRRRTARTPRRCRPASGLLVSREGAERVTARFAARGRHDAGGSRATALIGADGIHSWLRAQPAPATTPGVRWNGIQMWRGAVDWPAFDGGDAMVVAGDGDGQARAVSDRAGRRAGSAAEQLGDLRAGGRSRRAAAGPRALVSRLASPRRSAIWLPAWRCRSSMSRA